MTLCGSCWAHFQQAFDQISLQPEIRRLSFFTVFLEMCDLCMSVPFSSGIATITGHGIQVARSHLRSKVTPNQSRAAEAAQPSSDFGGAAESSPAKPISAGPAQPAQPSRAMISRFPLSALELSGEPTYRYMYTCTCTCCPYFIHCCTCIYTCWLHLLAEGADHLPHSQSMAATHFFWAEQGLRKHKSTPIGENWPSLEGAHH